MAALAGAAALPGSALALGAKAVPIDEFLKASSRLSGIALDKSYSQMAETIWSILSAKGGEQLQRLMVLVLAVPEAALDLALKRAGLMPTAQAVLSAWYSGAVTIDPKLFDHPVVRHLCGDLHGAVDPAAPHAPITWVFAYDEALTWQACSYTKPSAACGGPFGYWQDAPA